MNKRSIFMLILALTGLSGAVSAAQFCRSQSEIPATTPTARFSDHGDGTLTDTQTGLMWAKCAEGLSDSGCRTGSVSTYTWQAALDWANTSTLAGHANWCLPNVNELRSIVEGQCRGPAINLSVFPNSPTWQFWSASPDLNSHLAWYVVFGYGITSSSNRGNDYYVRLVRNGQ